MSSKKTKPQKKEKWKPFKPEQYQDIISRLAHFSAKTVNSNTPAFGVRIGANDHLSLPYVGVTTIELGLIPVDYVKNAGPTATVVKQVSAVVEEGLQDYEDPPEQDIKSINEAAEVLKQQYSTPLSLVGMRLRQIILQDEKGDDIALTPLHSAGFSKELERRLDVEREIDKEINDSTQPRPRGYLEVGGANPQNVGRYTRSMQRPLWFNAPTENMEIRKAFAIHYQGIGLAIPHGILAEFIAWRRSLLTRHLGKMPSDQQTREKERVFLIQIVQAVATRAIEATELLKKHSDKLPGGELTSETMDPVLRGLLDPSLRVHDWKNDFAKKLHLTIIDSKVRVEGELRSLNISQEDSERWISIIEETL